MILVCSVTRYIHLKRCSKQQLHQLTIVSAIYPSNTLVSYKTNVNWDTSADSKLILDISHCSLTYRKPMADEPFLEVEELHVSQPRTLTTTVSGPFQPPTIYRELPEPSALTLEPNAVGWQSQFSFSSLPKSSR